MKQPICNKISTFLHALKISCHENTLVVPQSIIRPYSSSRSSTLLAIFATNCCTTVRRVIINRATKGPG